jgi:putative sterol carrier protein
MPDPTIKDYMQGIQTRFDPSAARGLDAVYQFQLTGVSGGQYHLVVKDGTCVTQEGTHPRPHVTFSLPAADCLGLLNGSLDGTSLYLSGRLKITGDLGLAMRLSTLFRPAR